MHGGESLMAVQGAQSADAIVVGELIRKRREAIQMSVAKLAKQIEVSRNTITNYESGRTEPTASHLIAIGRALGSSIGELLGSGSVAHIPRFAFRSHAALRKDPLILARARNFLRAYAEIEEITGARLCVTLRQYVCDTGGSLGDRDIETAAETMRQTCGLRDTGPENIARVLEGVGVRCLFFDHDSKGLDGISTVQDDMLLILLRDRKKNIERTIFSGAHELGHLVLHPHLFTTDSDAEDTSRDYEKEADKFAGYLLVPSDELLRVWREERLDRLPVFHSLLLLKRVFHVSFHCLYRRIFDLNLSKMEYPAFIATIKGHLGILGKAAMEDLEPEPLKPEALYRSTRFQRLVTSAFLQRLISITKVAELLQVTVDEAVKITEGWLTPEYEVEERSV
jgi:Zn-dependent peptidase ImmA (M78 family)/transcriptional regulator with XRE-family HTH domain